MREYWKDKEIMGHSIKQLKLTDEELSMDITVDRLREYEDNVFEDTGFLNNGGEHLFAGFLMGKYPEKALDILNIVNYTYSIGDKKWNSYEYMNLEELFCDEDGYINYDDWFGDFCEFINMTKYSKERVNIFLISYCYYFDHDK